MTATALLSALERCGSVVTVCDGQPRCEAPAGALTGDLRRAWESNRAGVAAVVKLRDAAKVREYPGYPGLILFDCELMAIWKEAEAVTAELLDFDGQERRPRQGVQAGTRTPTVFDAGAAYEASQRVESSRDLTFATPSVSSNSLQSVNSTARGNIL